MYHCCENLSPENPMNLHVIMLLSVECIILLLVNFIEAEQGQKCTMVGKDSVSCVGRNLTRIPVDVPSTVVNLDFSFNFLDFLDKHTFSTFINLQVMDLTRCHIHQIESDAFHGVNNLTTLILTGNPVTFFGRNCLNSLYALQKLVLVDVGLASLKLEINCLSKIQELRVGTNQIGSLSLPLFMKAFRNFTLLDLHANNISIIQAEDMVLFQTIRNMTLILSSNPILHIEPGSFRGIVLEELNFQASFVSVEAQKEGLKALAGLMVNKLFLGSYHLVFRRKVPNGDYLDGLCLFHFNEIYSVFKEFSDSDLHVFRCMANATKIFFKRGYFNYFDDVQFLRLKELYLGKTLLVSIPRLSKIPTLEKVVVNAKIPMTFYGFSDLPVLRYVDLSGNHLILRDCCSQYFQRIPNMQYLNLSENNEIGMAYKPFSGLEMLEVFDVHNTRLNVIYQYEMLQNLQRLKYLDISETGLFFMSYRMFRRLNNLTVLKTAGNTFSGNTLDHIFQNLTSLVDLDISNCGIRVIPEVALKGLKKLQNLYLSRNQLTTVDFLAQSKTKLMSLYVDKNSITSISMDVLRAFSSNLSVFDLALNPIECSCSQREFIMWLRENQKIFKHSENTLCVNFDFRVTDFNLDSCEDQKGLIVVFSLCGLLLVLVLLFLAYRFQFSLWYCFIIFFKGYRKPQEDTSYDAFVIFSSHDDLWVMNELRRNLENGVPPLRLCLHMRDFQVGKSITSNIIDEGIMGSRKVIVVVSQHFVDSAWCRFEFELAQSWLVMEQNANIIIVILEDVEEGSTKKVIGLHKHLRKNTYLKWSREPLKNKRFWIRLRKAVIDTKK